MEIICCYNRKGGTGKTTTTVNIGGVLSMVYDKRVLIVDCDSQCNTTKFLFTSTDTQPKDTLETYLRDDTIDVDKIIYPIWLVPNHKRRKVPIETNIDLIPASPYMDSIEDMDILALRRLLEKVSSNYDYCLIDCTPYLAPCTLSALCASRWVLTVGEADFDSLQGYGLLIDTINNIKESGYNDTLELLGIYLNKIKSVDSTGEQIMNLLKEGAGDSLFHTFVRDAVISKTMRGFGFPACYFAPSSKFAKDYTQLTKEMLNKIERTRIGE